MAVLPMERRLSLPEEETDDLLRCVSPQTLSELLDVKVTTLQEWRDNGYGPKSFKLGRLVRYRMSAVREFLDEVAS